MQNKKGVPVSLRIPRALRDAVDLWAKKERRSRTVMTEILLEEALTARGITDHLPEEAEVAA